MASKVASQKAPSKRGRRARNNEELRRMVREACEAEFARFAGRPWPEVADLLSEDGAELQKIEDEAREIHSTLRAAITKAIEFAERSTIWSPGAPLGGDITSTGAAGTLQRHARAVLDPVLQSHLFAVTAYDKGKKVMVPRTWPTRARDRALEYPRATLARMLDDHNVVGLPVDRWGRARRLTAREMAVVSLLLGNWPSVAKTSTVAEVIKAEANLMRESIARARPRRA